MQRTTIPYVTHSWGVVTGCSGPKGVPCPYCYGVRMAARWHRSFEPTCHPEKLGEPLKLKRPARIFINSFGDLFDPAIPAAFIDDVLEIISACPHHTFLALTKRAELIEEKLYGSTPDAVVRYLGGGDYLRNLWLGVTCEHQAAADERIPYLLQVPAAVRFVSVEPLLGHVWIEPYLWLTGASTVGPWRDILGRKRGGGGIGGQMMSRKPSHDLNWIICGEDSSPGAALPDPAWVESIVEQCKVAGVPLFVKEKLARFFPIQEFPEVQP